MKNKKGVRASLFFFLIICVVAIYTQLKDDEKEQIPETQQAELAAVEAVDQNVNRTIVYYFHGNMRCKTCKTIESYTAESIKANFADVIQSGDLEFRIVNIEEKQHEHFVEDYELSTRSVVVSRLEKGNESEWRRLDRVWELVNNESAFKEYIHSETSEVLKG